MPMLYISSVILGISGGSIYPCTHMQFKKFHIFNLENMLLINFPNFMCYDIMG